MGVSERGCKKNLLLCRGSGGVYARRLGGGAEGMGEGRGWFWKVPNVMSTFLYHLESIWPL